MKSIVAVFLIAFFVSGAPRGQSASYEALVSQGIELHKQGSYKQAVAKYKAAVRINRYAAPAYYELALAYYDSKKISKAVRQVKKVIALSGDLIPEAYLLLGNIYYAGGRTKDAVKTYREAITRVPDDYRLHFNLAFTHYNRGEEYDAEKAVVRAITINPSFPDSHRLLSKIMDERGNRVPAILPLYYFLMLEPDSENSPVILEQLLELLTQGVEQDEQNNPRFIYPLLSEEALNFYPAESLVNYMVATKYLSSDEINGHTAQSEKFARLNTAIFTNLERITKEINGFWHDYYLSTFAGLTKTTHLEAFSYYISQSSKDATVSDWMRRHPEEMAALAAWIDTVRDHSE